MNDFPQPLTPPDCDLRGMNFMPLDVIRLTNSDFFAKTSGESFKCAVTLWCKSWLQVPAGSLPNDEKVLAFLSGAGSKWKRLRSDALDGFIQCADGRLYHPVIAEKALEAWEKRGSFRDQTEEKLSRQQRWRERQKQLSQQLRDVGVTPPVGASLSTLETLLSSTLETQASTVPSTLTSTVDARETPKTGTGTGTGTEDNNLVQSSKTARAENSKAEPPRPSAAPDPDYARFVKASGMAHFPPDVGACLAEWQAAGAMIEDVETAVSAEAERMAKRRFQPRMAKVFDDAVRAHLADQAQQLAKFQASADHWKDAPPHPDDLIRRPMA